MFEAIGSLLGAVNALTPIGLVGLSLIIIWYQTKNNKVSVEHTETLQTIKGNDLHNLPEMLEALRRIETLLQGVNDNTVYIKARINGGH